MRTKVKTYVEAVSEIRGLPSAKIERIIALNSVYAIPFNSVNVSMLFTEVEFEVMKDCFFYNRVKFTPKTISDFVSICSSLKVDLYWEEDVFNTINI